MLQAEPIKSGTGESRTVTHPHAYRMVAIAFLTQNVIIACVYGSFSVLLTFVETRLHIGRELSTLGAPATNLACAISAPIVGSLAARFSLRSIGLVGSALGVAGLVLLALGGNYLFYILAYGLFLGPAMAISLVVPGTLITRWFGNNAGKALGMINTQLLVVFVPLAVTWLVRTHGLPATYLALAVLPVLSFIAAFFIIDRPPGSAKPVTQAAHNAAPVADGSMTMMQLLGSIKLWALAMAFIANSTATVILLAHMVPLARSWGFSAEHAALLLSIQSLAGLVGTLFFGWVADKLGGPRTLTLLIFDATLLWLLLLLHPNFTAMVAIIAVFGMHSSGAIPVTSLALSQVFGQENFSRAYGLMNLLNLPFGVLCVPAASFVFTHTGSYTDAIIGAIIFLAITCLMPLAAVKRRPRLVAS